MRHGAPPVTPATPSSTSFLAPLTSLAAATSFLAPRRGSPFGIGRAGHGCRTRLSIRPRTAAPPPRPNVRRRLRDGGDHRLGCDVALAATAPACCRGKPAPDARPPGQDRRRPRLGIHRRGVAAIRTACRGSRRQDQRVRRNGHGRPSTRPGNPMDRRATCRRPGTSPALAILLPSRSRCGPRALPPKTLDDSGGYIAEALPVGLIYLAVGAILKPARVVEFARQYY